MDFVDELMDQPPGEVPGLLERAVRRLVNDDGHLHYAPAVKGVTAAVLLAGRSLPTDVAEWRSTLTVELTTEAW